MKFKTQYTWEHTIPEPSKKPSETVPNQAMSIREIMYKYAQGQPIAHNPNLLFTGDECLPNLDKMDPVDRDQYIVAIGDKVQSLDEQKKQLAKEAAEKEAQADLEKYKALATKLGLNPIPASAGSDAPSGSAGGGTTTPA